MSGEKRKEMHEKKDQNKNKRIKHNIFNKKNPNKQTKEELIFEENATPQKSNKQTYIEKRMNSKLKNTHTARVNVV